MRGLPSVCSISTAYSSSRSLRSALRSLPVTSSRASCCVSVLPPRVDAAGGLVGIEGGAQLGDVVARMLEEALVFGGDHGARQPAFGAEPRRRAAAAASAQHRLGAQALDGEAG